MLSDAATRKQALRPDQSYIVQAPAGSGKTALLVYRILNLLTTVERPEEILAITFTRKATAEMRQRLLELLQAAEAGKQSNDEFEQQGITLAQEVLKRDQQFDWHLLDSPEQLQLQTIDSFCAKLSGEMPWLSRLGDRPQVTDQAEPHYEAAVEQLFMELLSENSSLSRALQVVMLELDYDYSRARRLFVAMLSKRDQWLRHLVSNQISDLRIELESSWQALRAESIARLNSLVSRETRAQLHDLACVAADNLNSDTSPLSQFDTALTSTTSAGHWHAYAFLLLTKEGKDFRKQINRTMGFPPELKQEKDRLKDIIETLRDNVELLTALQEFYALPDGTYLDADWQQIIALDEVLIKLAGLLQLHFRANGECDYSEVAQRALMALSELDAPTDLALRMDYQLKHILVDEFQDTSRSQLELLRQLTAGWQPHTKECRTLFLVGDPMQSIYRFREADVSLFLQTANNASTRIFDNIDIQPLTLSNNFRSHANLVDWFNQTFQASFPSDDNVLTGAISYSPSQSSKPSMGEIRLRLTAEKQSEPDLVVEEVARWLASPHGKEANTKAAILVRSRTHLKDILPALERANIPYTGVDIQPLHQAPAILDLVTLCKALCRREDRIAWLALLRGPWLGLSLEELFLLSQDRHQTVFQQLNLAHSEGWFEESTHQRLSRCLPILRSALQQRQQVPLHAIVRWAWQSLGGPSLLGQLGNFRTSHNDIDRVLHCIESLEQGGDLPSVKHLDTAIEKLFAQPSQGETAKIMVSTIHKAKGLQYDTVILPSLERKSRPDDKDILMWAERNNAHGDAELLLAPIHTQEDKNSHYNYLRRLEAARGRQELVRLMYVACTRAERSLVLLASTQIDEEELKDPVSSSLLATVWDSLQNQFELSDSDRTDDTERPLEQNLLHLPNDFQAHFDEPINWQAKDTIFAQSADQDRDDELEFEWATELATAVGIVLHNWLETNSSQLFTLTIGDTLRRHWRSELSRLRVPQDSLQAGIQRLEKAVNNIQRDPNAQFIFAEYAEQQNELSLSTVEGGQVKQQRIDRTFVDADDNRWIVDYKTTVTQSSDLQRFVDQQVTERHRPQLERYGRLMRNIDSRPIILAVYFPLLEEFRSWTFEG